MVGFNDKFKEYWTKTVKAQTEVCTPEAERLYTLVDMETDAEQKALLDSLNHYRDLPGQVYIAEMREYIELSIEEGVVDEDVLDVIFQVQATLNSQAYWDLAFGEGFENCEEAQGRKALKDMMNELVGML